MHLSRYEASTLSNDPNFGVLGRHVFDFVGTPGSSQPVAGALALLLDAGRPLAVGTAGFGPTGSNADFAVARLFSAHLVQDGFELGTTAQWGVAVRAP